MLENSLTQFLDQLGSKSPTPGGGSVAAYVGALSVALAQMDANLTIGKKGYESFYEECEAMLIELQSELEKFLEFCEADIEAFNRVSEALLLPKDSLEQIEQRNKILEEALYNAAQPPFMCMQMCQHMLERLDVLAKRGNRFAVSDVGIAADLARSCAFASYLTILNNAKHMKNKPLAAQLIEGAQALSTIIGGQAQEIAIYVEQSMLEG